jgi:hypothetical protein
MADMTTPLNFHLINLVPITTVEKGVTITAESPFKVY